MAISQQERAFFIALGERLAALRIGVSVEALIGAPGKRGAGKRGPAPKLQQQLERVHALPKAQQKFVMQMLDTVLQQQGG